MKPAHPRRRNLGVSVFVLAACPLFGAAQPALAADKPVRLQPVAVAAPVEGTIIIQDSTPAPGPSLGLGGAPLTPGLAPGPAPLPSPAPLPGPDLGWGHHNAAEAFSAFTNPQIAGSPSSTTTDHGCMVCGLHAGSPLPVGSFVNRCYEIEAANARLDRLVIYPNEWICQVPELKPAGKHHLDWICATLAHFPGKVRIVPSGHIEIDLAHVALVAAVMRNYGIAQAEALIELAPPIAEGLRYDEIERVGTRVLIGATSISTTTQNSTFTPPLAFPSSQGFQGIR